MLACRSPLFPVPAAWVVVAQRGRAPPLRRRPRRSPRPQAGSHRKGSARITSVLRSAASTIGVARPVSSGGTESVLPFRIDDPVVVPAPVVPVVDALLFDGWSLRLFDERISQTQLRAHHDGGRPAGAPARRSPPRAMATSRLERVRRIEVDVHLRPEPPHPPGHRPPGRRRRGASHIGRFELVPPRARRSWPPDLRAHPRFVRLDALSLLLGDGEEILQGGRDGLPRGRSHSPRVADEAPSVVRSRSGLPRHPPADCWRGLSARPRAEGRLLGHPYTSIASEERLLRRACTSPPEARLLRRACTSLARGAPPPSPVLAPLPEGAPPPVARARTVARGAASPPSHVHLPCPSERLLRPPVLAPLPEERLHSVRPVLAPLPEERLLRHACTSIARRAPPPVTRAPQSPDEGDPPPIARARTVAPRSTSSVARARTPARGAPPPSLVLAPSPEKRLLRRPCRVLSDGGAPLLSPLQLCPATGEHPPRRRTRTRRAEEHLLHRRTDHAAPKEHLLRRRTRPRRAKDTPPPVAGQSHAAAPRSHLLPCAGQSTRAPTSTLPPIAGQSTPRGRAPPPSPDRARRDFPAAPSPSPDRARRADEHLRSCRARTSDEVAGPRSTTRRSR